MESILEMIGLFFMFAMFSTHDEMFPFCLSRLAATKWTKQANNAAVNLMQNAACKM